MDILATIGQMDEAVHYLDRPTVKIIIKRDDELLILNDGLLPGGGVDADESDQEAIARELLEELGITVKDIHAIGTVVQYRTLINQKYIINGYTAELHTSGGTTNPQNDREANFVLHWFSPEEAIAYVSESIETVTHIPMSDAANQQSKLYNLMTTLEFLKAVR